MDSHSAREKPMQSTQPKGNGRTRVLNHRAGRCGDNRLWVEVGAGRNKQPDTGTSLSSRCGRARLEPGTKEQREAAVGFGRDSEGGSSGTYWLIGYAAQEKEASEVTKMTV